MTQVTIEYRRGAPVTVEQFRDVLVRSTLAARRPVDNRETLAAMLDKADLVVTAWAGATIVGVSRSLTDFAYVCYLADLAVDVAYQRQGIGRELVAQTRSALGEHAMIVLLAAPAAADYYGRLGFTRHERCWVLAPPGKR